MRVTEMKQIIAIAACVLMLAGCASYGLSPDATPEQIKAARCADAMTAKALADANLAILMPQGPEGATAKAFWLAYLAGSNIGVKMACGGN